MNSEQLFYMLFVGVASIVIGYLLATLIDRLRGSSTLANKNSLLAKAKYDADIIIKDAEIKAKEENIQRKEDLNKGFEKIRLELREQEKRLEKREDGIEEKLRDMHKRERLTEVLQNQLQDRKNDADLKNKKLGEVVEKQEKRLLDMTGISRDQAEKMLLENLERSLSKQFADKLKKHDELLKDTAKESARKVLAMAVQRYASQHSVETTVSTVDIPNDDIKGRIIGREGRNIRTFQNVTGVDLIVDDTPGVVVVSAFDSVRREIARLSLLKLIQDGRIHPTKIEEVVKESQEEMEKHILEVGREALHEVNIGPLNEKLIQLLGRLKFRTSYSQNVLRHSVEVAFLAGMLADELGLDGRLARKCGLLHDIGKAADHEMEGGHPKIGAELSRRYGETNPDVLHAIAGHHDDITVDHIYTVLVATADAISAARPGARRETLEKYVKRLEELEAIACGFPDVEQAFAIQAGRELRVIANASKTSDEQAIKTCYDIARAIEEQMNYPGEIKVTVIRELRVVEIAK